MLRGKPQSNKPLNQAETVDANLSEEMAWSAAQAKARRSEVIDLALRQGPQAITRNTRPAVVVVSIEEWARNAGRKAPTEREALCTIGAFRAVRKARMTRLFCGHCEPAGPAGGRPEDWLREAISGTLRAQTIEICSSPVAPQKKPDGPGIRCGKRCPGESPGPPFQCSAGGSVDPGFPHGSSPWAQGPRESAPVAVSSSVGRPSGRSATRDDGKISLRSNAHPGVARDRFASRGWLIDPNIVSGWVKPRPDDEVVAGSMRWMGTAFS